MRAWELMAEKEEGLSRGPYLYYLSLQCREEAGLQIFEGSQVKGTDFSVVLEFQPGQERAGRQVWGSASKHFFPKLQTPGRWVWPPGKVTNSPSLDVFQVGCGIQGCCHGDL